MLRAIPVVVLTLLTASCQSDRPSSVERVRVYPQLSFHMADANCRMLALAQQRPLYARGTPNFVSGARNRNRIRMEQSYKRCMTPSGWKSKSL